MIIFLTLFTLTTSNAQEKVDIPSWVLAGILRVETGSYYKPDGTIRYVNKARGRAGERGCFQIRRIAFDQVKHKGEQFWMIEQDTVFCEEVAWRYLSWLYLNSAKKSWLRSIEKFNAGPGGRNPAYLADVLDAAKRDGYDIAVR